MEKQEKRETKKKVEKKKLERSLQAVGTGPMHAATCTYVCIDYLNGSFLCAGTRPRILPWFFQLVAFNDDVTSGFGARHYSNNLRQMFI